MTLPSVPAREVPTATAAIMRRADAQASARFNIEPVQLMEAAGLLVARFIASFMGGVQGRSIALICGPGNNGGDGLVAARYAHQRGAQVKALVVPPSSAESLAARHLRTLRSLGIEPAIVGETTADLSADLVVDALLGTGVKLPVRQREATLIAAINRVSVPVIAVDVPSGLDADTGDGRDSCVRASATVTLGAPKPGLIGCPRAGRLFLADIGLPAALFAEAESGLRAAFARGDLLELV